MNGNIREYNFPLTTNVPAVYAVTVGVVGDFIRCTSALGEFQISIDNGPLIPFGLGREIRTPQVFSSVRVEPPSVGVSGAYPVTLLISEGVRYDDDRVQPYTTAQFKDCGATKIRTAKYTQAALDPLENQTVSRTPPTAGQFKLIFKNTGALRCLIGDADSTADLAASTGLIVDPGEAVEIPIGASVNFPNGMPLLVRADAGATYSITYFCY